MKNLTLIFLVVISLLTCTTPTKVTQQQPVISQNTANITKVKSQIATSEILWDTWGVPHIYATNETDLYYGMGWAQMHSHGDLLMKLYVEARGEAPKYLGERALELTKRLHTIGIPRLGKSLYKNLTDGEKQS